MNAPFYDDWDLPIMENNDEYLLLAEYRDMLREDPEEARAWYGQKKITRR